MDMRKILQAIDRAAPSRAVAGASEMASFVSIVKGANVNSVATEQPIVPAVSNTVAPPGSFRDFLNQVETNKGSI